MALIGLSISQFFMCSKYAAPKSSYHSRQLGCIAFRWNWFSSSSCSSSFIVEDEIVQLGLFSWQSVPKGEDEEEVKDRLFFLCRANCLAAACCCYCCLLVVHQILAIKATAAVDIYQLEKRAEAESDKETKLQFRKYQQRLNSIEVN